MRVLVTGASGFVGQRLVVQLANSGHDVFALARRYVDFADDARPSQSRATITRVLQDLETLDVATLPKVDAVISLAQSSLFREFPDQAQPVFDVNVTANLKILQWAANAGVRKFVHASSGGIYAGRPGKQFLETDLLAVDSPLGFYLGTKLCSEIVFHNFRHFFETSIILRPFFIYGPNQRKDMFIARLIESVQEGRPISLQGDNGLRVNPIYVDDAVDAFAAALDVQGPHVINIAGPDTLTLRDVGVMIGQAVGKDPVFETRPGSPVDYVGDLSLANEKLGRPRVSFARGIDLSVGGSSATP